MEWRIGPWRENQLLKEKLASYEHRYQQMKNNELRYRCMWLETYRSLLAQQKGCLRLSRRLHKLLSEPDAREGR